MPDRARCYGWRCRCEAPSPDPGSWRRARGARYGAAWRGGRLANSFTLHLEKGVQLGRADEIVLRQTADGMRHIFHAATVVSHDEIRMVPFAVRHPRGGVHERHRVLVIVEVIRLVDGVVAQFPTRDALQQRPQLRRRQCRDAALARLAPFARELADAVVVKLVIRLRWHQAPLPFLDSLGLRRANTRRLWRLDHRAVDEMSRAVVLPQHDGAARALIDFAFERARARVRES